MKNTWQPSWVFQGLNIGPIHVGRIASQVVQEAMSFVFNDVFIAESEASARSLGAKALISAKWSNKNESGFFSATISTTFDAPARTFFDFLFSKS